jgi:hypothetical protein
MGLNLDGMLARRKGRETGTEMRNVYGEGKDLGRRD